MFCPDLRGVSVEEIVEEMRGEGVTEARRIRRRDRERDTLIETDTLILTFDRPTLPEEVKVGYLAVRVRPHVPDPIRCFKCQSFGHVSQRCRGEQRCGICSVGGHEAKDCPSDTPRCANCSGAHRVWSRDCPRYRKEREIRAVMTKDKVPYREAQRTVTARAPSRTYSETVVGGSRAPQRFLTPTIHTLLGGIPDLNQMTVAQLIEILSCGAGGPRATALSSAADVHQEEGVGSVPQEAQSSSQTLHPIPTEAGRDGWTVVQGRRGPRRNATTRSLPAPQTVASQSAPQTSAPLA